MRKIVFAALLALLALTVSAEMHTFTLWGANQVEAEPIYIYEKDGDVIVMCRTATTPERGIVMRAMSDDDRAYIESLNLEKR